ncbi:hypothetical protein QMK38_08440 [Lysinibacillus fusiformis]|nr:hypothetical protein [Lysinibacillus fusiformis]
MLLKRLLPLLLVVIFGCSSNMTEVFANSNKDELKNYSERKVPQTLHIKYDYDDLYHFLNITEKEYKDEWKSGKTIAEMAEARDIYPQQLILYLAEKRFEALDTALQNKEIDEYFYYDYAISYMRNDILEFINRNPNKY